VKVAIAGLAGALGGGDQRRGPLGVAKQSRIDHLLDPCHPRPLMGARFELLDLPQQRGDDLRLAELNRDLGGGQQAPGTHGPLAWRSENDRAEMRLAPTAPTSSS